MTFKASVSIKRVLGQILAIAAEISRRRARTRDHRAETCLQKLYVLSEQTENVTP